MPHLRSSCVFLLAIELLEQCPFVCLCVAGDHHSLLWSTVFVCYLFCWRNPCFEMTATCQAGLSWRWHLRCFSSVWSCTFVVYHVHVFECFIIIPMFFQRWGNIMIASVLPSVCPLCCLLCTVAQISGNFAHILGLQITVSISAQSIRARPGIKRSQSHLFFFCPNN